MQAIQLSFIFLLPSVFLSGYVFPIEGMPPFFRLLTYLIPLKYYLLLVRGIVLRGASITQLWEPLLSLAGFTVLIIGDGPELFAERASAAHLDSNSTGHHDAPMRTTVTLEPDIAANLKEFAHRSRTSFKAALNTVLRRGLAAQVPDAKRGRRFVVEPHDGRFKPGLDLGRLNQLTDQLETEAFVAKARDRR